MFLAWLAAQGRRARGLVAGGKRKVVAAVGVAVLWFTWRLWCAVQRERRVLQQQVESAGPNVIDIQLEERRAKHRVAESFDSAQAVADRVVGQLAQLCQARVGDLMEWPSVEDLKLVRTTGTRSEKMQRIRDAVVQPMARLAAGSYILTRLACHLKVHYAAASNSLAQGDDLSACTAMVVDPLLNSNDFVDAVADVARSAAQESKEWNVGDACDEPHLSAVFRDTCSALLHDDHRFHPLSLPDTHTPEKDSIPHLVNVVEHLNSPVMSRVFIATFKSMQSHVTESLTAVLRTHSQAVPPCVKMPHVGSVVQGIVEHYMAVSRVGSCVEHISYATHLAHMCRYVAGVEEREPFAEEDEHMVAIAEGAIMEAGEPGGDGTEDPGDGYGDDEDDGAGVDLGNLSPPQALPTSTAESTSVGTVDGGNDAHDTHDDDDDGDDDDASNSLTCSDEDGDVDGEGDTGAIAADGVGDELAVDSELLHDEDAV